MSTSTAEAAASPAPARPDLRERRRRATRAEIGAVALDLVERDGYAATTVEDIAHAAGVSARTFFRYFAGKEAAVLAPDEEAEEVLARHLARVRPDRPLLEQVEDAVAALVQHLAAEPLDDVVPRVLRVRRLVLADPALTAAALGLQLEQAGRVAAMVAAAAGTSPDDLRTRTVAELAGTALRLACDEWARRAEAGERPDLVALHAECRAVLREVVAAGGPRPEVAARDSVCAEPGAATSGRPQGDGAGAAAPAR
ncbi:TetR family transcriptional regulator [Pseudokineococcus basanitobsidens]|uniref:TetR family transcriptional regulator n=1 Tax=Pseudokineococcus basanitobsidens TaxID=1926649 RepID=A0ABU8RN62_9ACTN